jgi:hypothetical protein
MFALFGYDLMSINASEYILNDIFLVSKEGEIILNPIEEDRTELIDVHLHKDFNE